MSRSVTLVLFGRGIIFLFVENGRQNYRLAGMIRGTGFRNRLSQNRKIRGVCQDVFRFFYPAGIGGGVKMEISLYLFLCPKFYVGQRNVGYT